ncbi:MAG: phosphatase PAP2 family protein, partial [Clostridia bacterium]|nr:phosphatase PAP2 family protein [Clostridia bacterium]
FLGATVNAFLKMLCCVPRPWLRDPSFRIVESAREAATGYSFPSGHTQSAGGLFFGIARSVQRLWLRLACVLIVLLVGFSRMYLGVHTPADVLVSLGVSLLLVLLFWPLFRRAFGRPRLLALIGGVMLLAGAALIVYAELAPLPPNAIAEYSAHGAKTAYTMFGASLGFCVVLWLDTRYIRFATEAVWWAQILKVILGLALVVALRLFLKEPLLALCAGHNAAHMLRYLVMVLAGGALWPLSFRFFSRLGRRGSAAARE